MTPRSAQTHPKARYEVRRNDRTVGPVTWEQIRRGRASGRIPDGAEVRRVGAWYGLNQLPTVLSSLTAPGQRHDHAEFEVRTGTTIIETLSSEHVRNEQAMRRFPSGAKIRRVGPWRPVEELLKTLASDTKTLRPPPVSVESRPGVGEPPSDSGELPAAGAGWPRDASPPPQPKDTWHLVIDDGEPTGPLGTDQIFDRIIGGTVPLTALARRMGTAGWLPVWDVPEFAEAVRQLPRTSQLPSEQPAPQTPKWYVMLAGQPPSPGEEPQEVEQIKRQIVSGAIPLSAKVRKVDAVDWRPVWDVAEFANAVRRLPSTSQRDATSDPAEPEQWQLIRTDGGLIAQLDAEQINELIIVGDVTLSAKVRLVGTIEWQPIWDVPVFAEAINQLSPSTWREEESVRAMLEDVDSTPEPTDELEEDTIKTKL